MTLDLGQREQDIVDALADSDRPLSRLELAATAGLSSWQAKQSIAFLRDQGLVEQNPGYGYRLVRHD